MLWADETRWRWRSFDSQASAAHSAELWVRVSALHRGTVTVYLSFEQVNGLKLFTAGSCCSCMHRRIHVHGLNQGGVACTRVTLSLTWGSWNVHAGAGQERLTNCDSYCNSTLHTPRRHSRDFWLLPDFFFLFPVGWDFLWSQFQKHKGESLKKNAIYEFWKSHCGWQRQGQLARQDPWLCSRGDFLRRAFITRLLGACDSFAGTGRNPSMPKLWWGQQLPDVPRAEKGPQQMSELVSKKGRLFSLEQVPQRQAGKFPGKVSWES